MTTKRCFISCLLVSLVACAGEADSASGGDSTGTQPTGTANDVAPAASGPFEMPIADVFSITGQGVVATGHVQSGSVSVGDIVCLNGDRELTVAGIESFRKVIQTIGKGTMGALLFDGITKDELTPGDVIRSCD